MLSQCITSKHITYILICTHFFQSNACIVWRRFANLFETSQSLFWASFGLVSLMDFELTGIKEFTRFWALLMFGSYSVCNLIVLLNMLIAMMSNSFQVSCLGPTFSPSLTTCILHRSFPRNLTRSGSLLVPSYGFPTLKRVRQCHHLSTSFLQSNLFVAWLAATKSQNLTRIRSEKLQRRGIET